MSRLVPRCRPVKTPSALQLSQNKWVASVVALALLLGGLTLAPRLAVAVALQSAPMESGDRTISVPDETQPAKIERSVSLRSEKTDLDPTTTPVLVDAAAKCLCAPYADGAQLFAPFAPAAGEAPHRRPDPTGPPSLLG